MTIGGSINQPLQDAADNEARTAARDTPRGQTRTPLAPYEARGAPMPDVLGEAVNSSAPGDPLKS